jgi:hypothetical protein
MRKVAESYPKFLGFSDGVMSFSHPSSGEWRETMNEEYTLYIKFYEWQNLNTFFEQNLSSKDIIDKLFEGDLGIYCPCKSFWYHYSYAATKKKADIVFQKISAPIKNPQLIGLACKHCEAILNKQMLKFQYKVISKSLDKIKQNMINSEMEEE